MWYAITYLSISALCQWENTECVQIWMFYAWLKADPTTHVIVIAYAPCPPRDCAHTCALTHTMWLSCTAYAHTCLCPYMCPYPHILESVNKHKSCHVLGQGSFWKCNVKILNPENDLLYNLSLYGMRTWIRKCYSHTDPVLVYWPNIPKSKICKK